MRLALAVLGVSVVLAAGAAGRQAVKPPPGVSLADLSWVDAEPVLTASAVVVIPLGAGALEQGPHLKLNSGERLARHLASRVQAAASVVIAPTLTYHAYPEFIEYPGTASLTAATAQAMTVDVVRGLAKHGPRRFYVLNTEPSALTALSGAAKTLADAGILLGYTDPRFRLRSTALRLWPRALAAGHADEVTTSMMLFVDPSAVDMTRAPRNTPPAPVPSRARRVDRAGFRNRECWATRRAATRANGQVLVETLVAGALEDIEAVRNAPLPAVKPRRRHRRRRARRHRVRPVATTSSCRAAARPARNAPSGCSACAFTLLMARNGRRRRSPDVHAGRRHAPSRRHDRARAGSHHDTTGATLFRRKEYRGSVHPLQLNDIRCPMPGMAIADGKWELRLTGPPARDPMWAGARWCCAAAAGLADRSVALHRRPAAQHHAGADDSQEARLARRPRRRLTASGVRSAFGPRLGSGLQIATGILGPDPTSNADLTPNGRQVPF